MTDHWRHHPHVRSGDQLTVGERSADRMRNGFGSWSFIFGTLVLIFAWMLYNRDGGFDPAPWIRLNLVLSCFAALQGAIILLAAKRADAVTAELATAHYQATRDHGVLLASNTALTQEVKALTEQVRQMVEAREKDT